MRTLKESIFDEKENEDKLDNTVHIKTAQRAWKKNENNAWNSDKDHFGRELNIGDLVYNMQSNYIGVITNIYKEDYSTRVSMNNLVNDWNDDDMTCNLILIPKSCTKEFIKVITAKK